MSLKRKRTSQAKQAPPPPPEPPKSPSPPPWTHPFPRLPTVDESPSQPDTDVNDLKSVADSGVLSTALLQSRELWVQGYHFPKVWKPTRRGRKDPVPTAQYITTRLGVCPVVIGPHIFPDTRFLSVRKVDETTEKPPKPEKPAKIPPPPPPPVPATPVGQTAAAHANSLTVKALTQIAATSPEFSAILQAVANKTATPEQNAALAQYMRAASLFGPAKAAATTPLTTPKPVTPVTTIPKSSVTTISTPTVAPSGSPPKIAQTSMQSAPIPPVPKTALPHAPVPSPVAPRLIATPVTRIPPPSGNLNPIPPLPNPIRPAIATPVTRIPPPSTPVVPVTPTTPTPLTPSAAIPPLPTPVTNIPASSNTTTPVPPSQSVSAPSLTTPAPTTPQQDPMNFVEIGFELTEPGERLLIPRHTILEKFLSPQGGNNNVLASFILVLESNKVYIPITLKLSDCPARIWDSLHKYVYPQQVVVMEMERVMREYKRFEKSVLQLRVPVEEEGYVWQGIRKEVERKKYVRKKKEKDVGAVKEEGGEEEGGGKRRKSLVVGLKYTPTKNKKENKNGVGNLAATDSKKEVVSNETPTKETGTETVVETATVPAKDNEAKESAGDAGVAEETLPEDTATKTEAT